VTVFVEKSATRAELMQNHLRVLEAVHAYLRGTENWVYHLISNLPDTDVVIAAKSFLDCDFYTNDFEYLQFPFKKVTPRNKTLETSVFNLFAAGVTRFNFFAVEVTRGIYVPYSLYIPYIEKHVSDVDLIHSHFAPVGWAYANLAKRLEVPHVVSFYGRDYEHIPFVKRKWIKRYEWLLREADIFLCEGNFGAKLLQHIGCAKEKIAVQRLGVDVNSIPFYKREKKAEELNLLQIATLTPKKGHIYTIKAFVEALQSCPNMSLTFVGPDVEGVKAKILAIIRQHNAQNKVTFLDWIDFNDLHAFMAEYHVFIHPSCYTATRDCEGGAPVVLLDAQATGMPIIATTHCDIPDEVIHNHTGLLTSEKDVEGLVNSIRYFYELSGDKYERFSTSARNHIRCNYDCKQNAVKLKEIYDACLG
jgi:colanic acid/amylovoran biosynthesis glycosyltransferase